MYDLDSSNLGKVEALGAKAMPDVPSLTQECDIIVTMVPATKHVQGLMRGDNGIFANAKKGSLLIDCSTIDPLASQELAQEAEKDFGLRMIDAPVSGGVTGAAAGTLGTGLYSL